LFYSGDSDRRDVVVVVRFVVIISGKMIYWKIKYSEEYIALPLAMNYNQYGK